MGLVKSRGYAYRYRYRSSGTEIGADMYIHTEYIHTQNPPHSRDATEHTDDTEQTNKRAPPSQSKKQQAEKLLRDIPKLKSVEYDPLNVDFHPASLNLPDTIDPDDPLSLFNLFVDGSMCKIITQNSNQYASNKGATRPSSRDWTATDDNEIRVLLGILIYMGVCREPNIERYWSTRNGTEHTCIRQSMSLRRFEQLKRYLHISEQPPFPHYPYVPHPDDRELMPENEVHYDPDHISRIWWHKVEPLLARFKTASQAYYKPSSNISIDELMVRCYGRSAHTFKMPSKPISKGYKVFSLADHGYIWDFIPASRVNGVVGVVKHKDLTMTGSMVLELLRFLPAHHNRYAVYRDNYFTSISLFQILRDKGIGACGTTRPYSAGQDFPQFLKDLRNVGNYVPWNTLCAIPTWGVLCFGWQGNNLVMCLTTIHTVHRIEDKIERKRKRPSITSTNSHITHAVFGDKFKKILNIPTVINDYNQYMGGVDICS